MRNGNFPTMLTIAGSDSFGGAGIQADIRTATALGVYPFSAITAVTSQNSRGIMRVDAVSDDMLLSQIESVVTDCHTDSVKIGMTPSVRHAEIIAECIRRYNLRNVVCDPVLNATSGCSLSGNSSDTFSALKNLVFPRCALLTPNVPEASFILKREIYDIEDSMRAAVDIAHKFGSEAVLLKGGHLPMGGMCVDILFVASSQKMIQLPHSLIDSRNLHGTGCVLSSAVASLLSKGKDIEQAVAFASEFLHHAIKDSANYKLGDGNGPVLINTKIL